VCLSVCLFLLLLLFQGVIRPQQSRQSCFSNLQSHLSSGGLCQLWSGAPYTTIQSPYDSLGRLGHHGFPCKMHSGTRIHARGAVYSEHTYTLLTACVDASFAMSQWPSFNGSNWPVQSLQLALSHSHTLVPSLLPLPSPVCMVCHGFLAHQSIHGCIRILLHLGSGYFLLDTSPPWNPPPGCH